MSNPPRLVFIPGSWHKPTCYNKIISLIKKHKLECISATLPSTLGNPSATFKDDVDVFREIISRETTHGHDVIVIAHSYGGMVGASVVKDFTQSRDAMASSSASASELTNSQVKHQSNTAGHVIGLILIATGFAFTGLAFMDPFFGHPPPSWRINKETGYADIVTPPQELFYHDLPEEEADYWTSQLTTQSLKALFEGGEFVYSGWTDVPVWYIGTVEDRGLPVVVQRMQVGMAREMGGSIEHRELQSSHSPFLSQPEETVGIILEAVEAFTGKRIEDAALRRELNKNIKIPESRFWQPLTWYRFGLPLVFGRILGRCILVFRWGRKLWNSN